MGGCSMMGGGMADRCVAWDHCSSTMSGTAPHPIC